MITCKCLNWTWFLCEHVLSFLIELLGARLKTNYALQEILQLPHSVGYIVWGPHYSGASARLQPQHQYILTWVALALSKQPFSMDTFPNIGQSLAFSVGLGVCQQQLLQNHGHEIGAQRDPHFILRAPSSDFLLTFNFPTFGRRAIGPSIYFSQNSRHQRAI